MRSMLSSLILLALSAPALAEVANPRVPEPESLALIVAGVIVAAVVGRKRK